MRDSGQAPIDPAAVTEWTDEVPGRPVVRIAAGRISIGRVTHTGEFREEFAADGSNLVSIESHERRRTVKFTRKPPPLRSFSLGSIKDVSLSVECASGHSRDRLMELLTRALAEEFGCQRLPFALHKAMGATITSILITLILTAVVGGIAGQAAAGVPLQYKGRWRPLVDLLYPVLARIGMPGVWVIGGVISVAIIIFLIRRIGDPAMIISIERRDAR